MTLTSVLSVSEIQPLATYRGNDDVYFARFRGLKRRHDGSIRQ